MKNKPNFFFNNRGFPNWGGGGGGPAPWEFFPHNPVFFSDNVPNSKLLFSIPLKSIRKYQSSGPFHSQTTDYSRDWNQLPLKSLGRFSVHLQCSRVHKRGFPCLALLSPSSIFLASPSAVFARGRQADRWKDRLQLLRKEQLQRPPLFSHSQFRQMIRVLYICKLS